MLNAISGSQPPAHPGARIPLYQLCSEASSRYAAGIQNEGELQMNRRLLLACVLFVIGAMPCGSHAADPDRSDTHSVKEIGLNAVLTATILVAVEKRIRDGKPDEAQHLIGAEYSRLLPLMREFDSEIVREPRFRELRDRVVRDLQTRWLKDPPMYLDEPSAEFLERTCLTIAECPKGRVHPLKEPSLPPAK
jgi:hypothetical protein